MKRDDYDNLIHTSVMKAFEVNKGTISYDIKDLMPQAVELSVIATLDVLKRLGHIPATLIED